MPRSSEQRRELRESRRAQILAAAARVFARKGFDRAQMSDVAREAGLGRGTVYWYFASKEQLFREVAHVEMELFLEATRQAAAAGEVGVPLFTTVMRGLLEAVGERPEGMRLLLWLLVDERAAEIAGTDAARFLELARSEVATLVRAAGDAGQIPAVRSPRALASLLVALGDGLLLHHLVDPAGLSIDEVEDLLLDLVGLAARGAGE